jgi:catechol-2,3-dioxygenase
LGTVQLIFLSRDPSEHHQIVLASGRPADLNFNVINQISLRVPDLATLRLMRDRVAADADVTELLCATHGNAVSIYFRDPEGNRLEVFMDSPWYCDDAIWARAEAIARSRPRFQSRAVWQAEMARRMGYSVQA